MALRLLSTIFTAVFFQTLNIASAEPIKIGWIGPLTGKAAILGVDTIPAMQLIFDEVNKRGGINGRPIDLITEDDQYTTANTVAAYEHLVHGKGIKAIVLLTYGGLFAIVERAMKDNVLIIDPLDCDERIAKLPENVICISKMTEDLGAMNAQQLELVKGFPAGIIYYDGDPFPEVASKATATALQKFGNSFAFSATYSDQVTDFKPVLLKAKKANLNSLFLYGYDPIGLGMKQARELGITAQFYTLATITSPDFQKLAGSALDGTYFPLWEAPRTDQYKTFSEKFSTKVGRQPYLEISTVPAYDIASLIVEALKQNSVSSDGSFDVNNLRRYFYTVTNYHGASGNITVDPDGATRSFVVKRKQWKDGKIRDAQ